MTTVSAVRFCCKSIRNFQNSNNQYKMFNNRLSASNCFICTHVYCLQLDGKFYCLYKKLTVNTQICKIWSWFPCCKNVIHLCQLTDYRHLLSVMKSLYVTGPEKTCLIYTKYTYSYYGIYLFFCVCYSNSVSFIEFLRIFCLYGKICVWVLCQQNKLLHFKD